MPLTLARKRILVVAILALALGLRLGEISRSPYKPIFDAGSYLTLASEIAHTGDYSLSSRSGKGAGGTRGPTTYFPPGYPYFLAAVDLIDGHETRRGGAVGPARVSQAVLGTVSVGLVGLVALECFGGTAALAALALAAIYPVLIELSAVLVAENLLTTLVLAAVWSALRARRARSDARRFGWLAGSGVLTGLVALTHFEGFLLVAPLAFAAFGAVRRRAPAAVSAPPRAPGEPPPLMLVARRSPSSALTGPLVLIVCAVLTVLPWTIRNAIVMHRFIPVSDETGITLVGTYNPASAHNHAVPYKWRFYLSIPRDHHLLRRARYMTEPQLSARLESQALHYIGRHPLAPLDASWHNLLRMFELEGSTAWRTSAASIDLDAGTAKIGVICFWALCLLALAGLALGRPGRAPRWVWLVPVLLALGVLPVNVETPRFREPIDPFLLLLAACAVERLVRRSRRLQAGPSAVGSAEGRRVLALTK